MLKTIAAIFLLVRLFRITDNLNTEGGTRLRVVLVTNNYHPMSSGVIVHVDVVADMLKSLGHQVLIVTAKYDDYKDISTDVIRFPSFVYKPLPVKFPIPIGFSHKIFQQIKAFQPDIIHSHHPVALGATAKRYAKRLGVPIVFTFHTIYNQYVGYVPLLPKKLTTLLCNRMVANYCNQVNGLITVTQSNVPLMHNYGVKNAIHVVDNMLPLSPFERVSPSDITALRTQFGIGDRKILLYVGRLSPEKQLSLLLQSYKIMLQKRDDLFLIIVGVGEERQMLEELALSLNIHQNLRFLGQVEYAMIPTLLKSASVFTFPSPNECRPMAILEAMAAKLPIVTRQALWSSDILEHQKTALLSQGDPLEFATLVLSVLDFPSIAQNLSENAYEAVQPFAAKQGCKKIFDLYEVLIDNNQKGQLKKSRP